MSDAILPPLEDLTAMVDSRIALVAKAGPYRQESATVTRTPVDGGTLIDMIHELHTALHGYSTARPESPKEVWEECLAAVRYLRLNAEIEPMLDELRRRNWAGNDFRWIEMDIEHDAVQVRLMWNDEAPTTWGHGTTSSATAVGITMAEALQQALEVATPDEIDTEIDEIEGMPRYGQVFVDNRGDEWVVTGRGVNLECAGGAYVDIRMRDQPTRGDVRSRIDLTLFRLYHMPVGGA